MEGKNPPKLLDRVRQKIRYLHYSLNTEKSYLQWIRRYIIFHNKRHPKDMGGFQLCIYQYQLTFCIKASISVNLCISKNKQSGVSGRE